MRDDLPLRVYNGRLPHWRQVGATYAVTFRLADSIPQDQLKSLRHWRQVWQQRASRNSIEADWHRFARRVTARTEAYLDKGYGESVFLREAAVESMCEVIRSIQESLGHISAYTIMPNHVHAIIRPTDSTALEEVIQCLKGASSRQINQALDRSGTLWSREFYDRIIRDEWHLYRVIQYIGNNAKRAGLTPEHHHRWLDPAWEKLGWGFRDA